MLEFNLVGVLSTGYVQVCGFLARVGLEERFPVVGYAEDEVCVFEGWDEGAGVVEVGADELDALGGEGLGCWG